MNDSLPPTRLRPKTLRPIDTLDIIRESQAKQPARYLVIVEVFDAPGGETETAISYSGGPSGDHAIAAVSLLKNAMGLTGVKP